MDAVPNTSSAKTTDRNSGFEIIRRRTRLEVALRTIEEQIAACNRQILDLVPLDLEDPTVVTAFPPTLEALESDPTYADDETYLPSALDEFRKAAFDARTFRRKQSQGALETYAANGMVAEATASRLQEIEKQIEALGSKPQGMLGRLLGTAANKKAALEAQAATLRRNLITAPQRMEQAAGALNIAEIEERVGTEDQKYDETLHARPAVAFSPRSQQSILMKSEGGLVTFSLPSGPTDTDLTTTVQFELDPNGDDTQAFARHFYEFLFKNHIGSGDAFDPALAYVERLVPFALEVVVVDGEQCYRLPQAFYDRFKHMIAA